MSAATLARITGAVYLLYFLTAVGGAQLSGGVTGLGSSSVDAIHRSTYDAGIAIGEVSTVLYLALVVLLYALLRSVNGTLATLSLAFGATGCAVTIVAAVFQNAAATQPELAVAFLNVSREALHVALVLFAAFDMSIGYLVYRSGFLPRLIGVAMLVAGAGWFTS